MEFEYIVFYKPFQVLSQFSKEGDKETLADYLKDIPKDVYPVGRLDYDTEGLLLLTNDKSINNKLLNPEFGHERTYLIQVDNDITEEAIQELREGVTISINGKPYHTKKARAKKLEIPPIVYDRNPPIRVRKNIPTSWVSLTLTEGKNRQVKKMTAAVGYPTLRLIRHSIGKLTIDNIAPGDYIKMDGSIKSLIFKK
ncbi:MAG: pseudouridine synthase [Flavipsychrobacter sp.]